MTPVGCAKFTVTPISERRFGTKLRVSRRLKYNTPPRQFSGFFHSASSISLWDTRNGSGQSTGRLDAHVEQRADQLDASEASFQ